MGAKIPASQILMSSLVAPRGIRGLDEYDAVLQAYCEDLRRLNKEYPRGSANVIRQYAVEEKVSNNKNSYY